MVYVESLGQGYVYLMFLIRFRQQNTLFRLGKRSWFGLKQVADDDVACHKFRNSTDKRFLKMGHKLVSWVKVLCSLDLPYVDFNGI